MALSSPAPPTPCRLFPGSSTWPRTDPLSLQCVWKCSEVTCSKAAAPTPAPPPFCGHWVEGSMSAIPLSQPQQRKKDALSFLKKELLFLAPPCCRSGRNPDIRVVLFSKQGACKVAPPVCVCVCVCMCVCAHPLGGAGSLQVSLTLLCGFGQVFFPLWATGSPWMGGEAGAGVSKGSSGSSGSAARGCQTSRARPAGRGSESQPRRPDHLHMQIPSLHPTLHPPDGLVQGNSC